MRSSLIVQKLAAKAGKFDMRAALLEARTSTVVKNNMHQVSRQNLMIIQGEGSSSQVENPQVILPEYDQLTQAFIQN